MSLKENMSFSLEFQNEICRNHLTIFHNEVLSLDKNWFQINRVSYLDCGFQLAKWLNDSIFANHSFESFLLAAQVVLISSFILSNKLKLNSLIKDLLLIFSFFWGHMALTAVRKGRGQMHRRDWWSFWECSQANLYSALESTSDGCFWFYDVLQKTWKTIRSVYF